MSSTEHDIRTGDVSTRPARIDADASPTVIEKQIDAKRADIDRTLHALEERFSPGQMFEQTLNAVRGNGGEVMQNLGRSFRDNPMPYVLTGIGLMWAMASQGGQGRSSVGRYRSRYGYDGDYAGQELDESYRGDRGREDYGRDYGTASGGGSDLEPHHVDSTVASTTGSFAASGTYGAGGAYGASSGTSRRTGGTAERDDDKGVLDKAREGVEAIGERLSGAGEQVSERLSGLSEDARARYEETRRSAAQRRRDWERDARDGMDSMRRYGRDAGYRGRRQARSMADSASNLVQEQPMVAGALGIAVGALIGSLLPTSEIEDRYLGERADEAKRVAREQAESGMQKVREEAEEGMTHAREKIEEVAGTAREKIESGAAEMRKGAEDALEEADREASGGDDAGGTSGTQGATSSTAPSGTTPPSGTTSSDSTTSSSTASTSGATTAGGTAGAGSSGGGDSRDV